MNFHEWKQNELQEYRENLVEMGFTPDAAQRFSDFMAVVIDTARDFKNEHDD